MRRVLTRSAVILVCGLAFLGAAWIAKLWYESRLPGTYNVMDYGRLEYGGGRAADSDVHGGHTGPISVARLRGPRKGTPDSKFTLTARSATVSLDSGRTIDALTFDGTAPGPELRAKAGDLVEVTLENEDVPDGVSIHWHGVDVPNAEDGVAGVTQDAVLPGDRYVYRFRLDQIGTFWYHSHQGASSQVGRGLFGAFVVERRDQPSAEVDLTLVAHTFEGVPTINAHDELQRRAVLPGTRVRLRLVNSDGTPHGFGLNGTPFRVAAIDGTELNAPSEIEDQTILLGGGARADLELTMPATPVRLSLVDTSAALALSSNGEASPPAPIPGPEFDPAVYGRSAVTPFDVSTRFDRRFGLTIDRKPGFLDGKPGLQWSINGAISPHVPVFVVEDGDLIEVTIKNDSNAVHPMHLHGHHMLVLSRDGLPVSGSPWWVDTLNVGKGERYVVAFRADNPGLWMDHCHNLRHAADGLTMHVAYAGVTTPFNVGDDHHNDPE